MANEPITFKVGNYQPSGSHAPGTLYFAVDTNNKICQIYFDESGGKRVNVVPEYIDCGIWEQTSGAAEPV